MGKLFHDGSMGCLDRAKKAVVSAIDVCLANVRPVFQDNLNRSAKGGPLSSHGGSDDRPVQTGVGNKTGDNLHRVDNRLAALQSNSRKA
jgi:hypothetical protein